MIMKKFLKVVGLIVAAVILFVLIAGIFVSKTYHLEKDITINAPREKVWGNVNSLHAAEKWSPWLESDPSAKITYEGTDGTVGAIYKWNGNKEMGSGTQTLTKVESPSRVESHLHFIEPFEGEADAYIQLTDQGNGTKAAWGFDTKYPYPMNVMLLFVNMDEMMGAHYNRGLEKLKSLSEAN